MSRLAPGVAGRVAQVALSLLLLLGLAAGLSLSWRQIQSGDACPVLGGVVPACHIATGAYLLMTLGVAVVSFGPRRRWRGLGSAVLFAAGWLAATGLAVLGSALEFSRGGICPEGPGGVPMCYLSLAACAVFVVLYAGVMRGRRASFRSSV